MSTNSNIEWTTHTFNPWWGCTKVHAGCKNCYAEAQDHRWGGNHWGNSPRRMVLGEWGKPAKWDAAAKAAGRVDSVFCASMCDLFEDYDGPVVDQRGKPLWVDYDGRTTNWNTDRPVTLEWLRSRVFELAYVTPNLRWLLLTKRPENITRMVPPAWLEKWPANVWTGTSPCDQATADECIPNLLRVPGKHFLRCEPLVGTVDLHDAFYRARISPSDTYKRRFTHPESGVHWVIVGGESGNKARPCHIEWVRDIVRQCKEAAVPVFVKQLGANPERERQFAADDIRDVSLDLHDRKGGNMAEWPEDLRVRELPS